MVKPDPIFTKLTIHINRQYISLLFNFHGCRYSAFRKEVVQVSKMPKFGKIRKKKKIRTKQKADWNYDDSE